LAIRRAHLVLGYRTAFKSHKELVLADLTTHGWLRKDPEETQSTKHQNRPKGNKLTHNSSSIAHTLKSKTGKLKATIRLGARVAMDPSVHRLPGKVIDSLLPRSAADRHPLGRTHK
jgi:hypothetical protein